MESAKQEATTVYSNLPEVIDSLNDRMRDVLDSALASEMQVLNVHTAELADGSGRWAATANICTKGGLEWAHRIIAPAPIGAPKWAQAHTEYETELLEANTA